MPKLLFLRLDLRRNNIGGLTYVKKKIFINLLTPLNKETKEIDKDLVSDITETLFETGKHPSQLRNTCRRSVHQIFLLR